MLCYEISANTMKMSFLILTQLPSRPNLLGICKVTNLTLQCYGADRKTDCAILLFPRAISLVDTVKCGGHKSCVFTTCAVVSYLLGCPAFLLLILSVQGLRAYNAAVTLDIRGWCFSISLLWHRL